MKHSCHARNCGIQVPPKLFMCRKHWFMVPKYLRDSIWATYTPGQESRKRPSAAYLAVTREAVKVVADLEASV